MTAINWYYFFEQNKESLIAGVLSGILLGVCSWIINIIKNTSPRLCISNKICHYSGVDSFYRIKVVNNNLSNIKIISANFVISYTPNGEKSKTKNDIIIATKKEDPLLFGLFANWRMNTLRTFDTFVIDAQKCIDKETIKKKTSQNIRKLYKDKHLTIIDFFKEDPETILSAVFYVQNYRTGVTRNYYQIFSFEDIISGKFKSGRSLGIEQYSDDPNNSDA